MKYYMLYRYDNTRIRESSTTHIHQQTNNNNWNTIGTTQQQHYLPNSNLATQPKHMCSTQTNPSHKQSIIKQKQFKCSSANKHIHTYIDPVIRNTMVFKTICVRNSNVGLVVASYLNILFLFEPFKYLTYVDRFRITENLLSCVPVYMLFRNVLL